MFTPPAPDHDIAPRKGSPNRCKYPLAWQAHFVHESTSATQAMPTWSHSQPAAHQSQQLWQPGIGLPRLELSRFKQIPCSHWSWQLNSSCGGYVRVTCKHLWGKSCDGTKPELNCRDSAFRATSQLQAKSQMIWQVHASVHMDYLDCLHLAHRRITTARTFLSIWLKGCLKCTSVVCFQFFRRAFCGCVHKSLARAANCRSNVRNIRPYPPMSQFCLRSLMAVSVSLSLSLCRLTWSF